MDKKIIWVIFVILVSNTAYADYFYTPFNFDSPTNHTFNISLEGYVNVTIPSNFSLVSGNLSGMDNLTFTIQSPNINPDPAQLFSGQIYLNNSLYDTYHLLSIADNKIVDTKVEIGHGDFNYIDSDGYIGTDKTLLFDIVRVWAMGSDILNEPAQDVTFNCTYPLIIPNTVDSKYTTYYGSDLTAEGYLSRMEGISMFRVFVLSQEIEYPEGSNYEIVCDTLRYSFPHTEVIADMPDINLSIRGLEPLSISMSNNSGYVTYTFTNTEDYDIKDIEFLWTIGTHTKREKLDFLASGDSIQYNLLTNTSGSVSLKARFMPEWMFNSRSPTYYEQTQFDTYYTPSFFDGLDPSTLFGNQEVISTSVFETQNMLFGIETFQNPPFDGAYSITYLFYNEDGQLITTTETQVVGIGEHEVKFTNDELEPNGLSEVFDVYTIVSILDDENDWYSFPMEKIGEITINALTSNAPGQVGLYDVIVSTEYTRYDVEDTIRASITIKNTGDTPDEDTILTYWLEDMNGNRFGETREQFLEVPVGETVITRELTLPLLSEAGEWRFRAEYETVVQPLVNVYDAFEVKDITMVEKATERINTIFKGNWGIIGLIGGLLLFLLLLILLFTLLGRRDDKWRKVPEQPVWRKEEERFL